MDDVKQWYVIHTYSGYENKVKTDLEHRVKTMDKEDKIFRILVPVEEQSEYKDGKKKITKKKIFPGYVLVEMVMSDDSWYVVRNTPGVTGIAGSSGGGQKPTPVSPKEIETVLKRMGMVDNSMYENYHVGDNIKIIHGTFANVEGKIVSIDKEAGTVKVDTVFFGRHTPVDVEFSEIIRLS